MIRYAIAANLVLLASTAMAQESGQSLDQAASDPTASLMSFQLQDFYSYRFHNLPGESANRVQFRAAIPFTLAGTSNIARVTVPYITDRHLGVVGRKVGDRAGSRIFGSGRQGSVGGFQPEPPDRCGRRHEAGCESVHLPANP